MKPEESFNLSKVNLYTLLYVDANYPDKVISFADRYLHWRNRDSIIKYFRKEIIKEKKKSFNILDVGCGMGDIAFKLKKAVKEDYSLQVIGVDNYKPAIDFANNRKKFLNRDDCHFKLMDACKLEFENDFFDIVICSQMIEHLKDPGVAIKQIYRVLKKNGLAIVSTPNKREDTFTKTVKIIFKKVFNYKEGISSQHTELKHPSIYHISVKNHKEWTKIFKQNGFFLQTKIGTGGMLYNDKFFEEHRILFGLMVIFDTLLENFPFSYLWSETLVFELRK